MTKTNYTIDASGKILGRLAAEIAFLLQGKNEPDYAPQINKTEEIVIINTSKLRVSGKKNDQKKYHRHSGYPGGLKTEIYKDVFKKDPNEVLRRAIYGMLPKNKLRIKMMRKLKLFKENAKS